MNRVLWNLNHNSSLYETGTSESLRPGDFYAVEPCTDGGAGGRPKEVRIAVFFCVSSRAVFGYISAEPFDECV